MRDVLQIDEFESSFWHRDDRIRGPIARQHERLRIINEETRSVAHVNREGLERCRMFELAQLLGRHMHAPEVTRPPADLSLTSPSSYPAPRTVAAGCGPSGAARWCRS